MTVDFITDDVIHWANTYHGPKFHALLCDPPYHLTSVDRLSRSSPEREPRTLSDEKQKSSSIARFFKSQAGFMGKSWDGGDIAFQPDTWAALAEHLLPGAFLMAFGGSRTYHRMACAVEDAGLVIHPAISYIFGSGFPKATRVDRQLPEGNLAQTWAGHRYGLQALKPAAEFVLVAQVPYQGRPVESIVETGAGALWVDGARIPASDKAEFPAGVVSETERIFGCGKGMYGDKPRGEDSNPAGRWPANLVLDDEAAARLDEMSGTGKSHGERNGKQSPGMFPLGGTTNFDDSGGASRFFFTYPAEQLDEADPFFYCAKSSRRERDAGLDGMPLKEAPYRQVNSDWKIDDRCRNGGYETAPQPRVRNPHPCLKPLALCRYLATLLLPPADYAPRRLLVPFGGVGSEAIGAMQAGWDEIAAIEREAEYVEIGLARVEYWRKQVKQLSLPV